MEAVRCSVDAVRKAVRKAEVFRFPFSGGYGRILFMDREKRKEEILRQLLKENGRDEKEPLDNDWAEQAQEDMLDWIEEQGIYIRQ